MLAELLTVIGGGLRDRPVGHFAPVDTRINVRRLACIAMQKTLRKYVLLTTLWIAFILFWRTTLEVLR